MDTAKMQAKRERAARRKVKIEARVAELKSTGLDDYKVSRVLESEYGFTEQQAWHWAHGKTVLSVKREQKPVPQFLQDWEAES